MMLQRGFGRVGDHLRLEVVSLGDECRAHGGGDTDFGLAASLSA
jgi:hypothetical protein